MSSGGWAEGGTGVGMVGHLGIQTIRDAASTGVLAFRGRPQATRVCHSAPSTAPSARAGRLTTGGTPVEWEGAIAVGARRNAIDGTNTGRQELVDGP